MVIDRCACLLRLSVPSIVPEHDRTTFARASPHVARVASMIAATLMIILQLSPALAGEPGRLENVRALSARIESGRIPKALSIRESDGRCGQLRSTSSAADGGDVAAC